MNQTTPDLPLLTEAACRTARDARNQDSVTFLESLHLVSYFFNNSNALVPKRSSLVHGWHIAFNDVQVLHVSPISHYPGL